MKKEILPLISIIVPVYKVEKYLDECVESIVNQTYKNLEIILIDDGSPDRCPEMCDKWEKKDKRIRVIHKHNGGVSSARNVGLDVMTGDYVGFVDSDDYIAENMYEELINALLDSKCKISSCSAARINGMNIINCIPKKRQTFTEQAGINSFFYDDGISGAVWDKLFHGELFSNIRFPTGETNEEYPLMIPLIMSANGIVFTGKQLYYYRMTEESITSSTWKTDAGIVLKHLHEMDKQIMEYNLTESIDSFRYFCARSAYGMALQLDKYYSKINNVAKKNLEEYIKIMKRNCGKIIFTKYLPTKDKMLYLMVISRTLRPIYQMLGRL